MKLHYHPLNKTLILLEVLEDMVTKLFPGECLVDSVTLSSNHFKAPHKRHVVSIFSRLCHCNLLELKGYTHAFETETLLGTMVNPEECHPDVKVH